MQSTPELANSDNLDANPATRALRVALLLDTRAWAGTESYVLTLARALNGLNAPEKARQIEISVATAPDSELGKRAKKAAIPLLPVARRGAWDLSTLAILTRRLRRGATDVVHVHNGRTALWGALAVTLAGRGACVATHHFIEPAHAGQSGLKGRVSGAVHAWIERHIQGHIAISRAVEKALEARGVLSGEQIRVVHNGIDLSPASLDETPLPPELQAPVVCVARLQREKDIPTLVRAMALLNVNRTDKIRCVVAGEGDDRALIEDAIARETGCNVELAGFTPFAASMLHAAQVAVLPSPAEPFGLALLEAMAQRKPVVAIGAGGPAEIVVGGQTGLLVPPGDAGAMAQALGELLDDPARARALGEAGFARLHEHFGAGRMAEQTLAVYRRALEPGALEPGALEPGARPNSR